MTVWLFWAIRHLATSIYRYLLKRFQGLVCTKVYFLEFLDICFRFAPPFSRVPRCLRTPGCCKEGLDVRKSFAQIISLMQRKSRIWQVKEINKVWGKKSGLPYWTSAGKQLAVLPTIAKLLIRKRWRSLRFLFYYSLEPNSNKGSRLSLCVCLLSVTLIASFSFFEVFIYSLCVI